MNFYGSGTGFHCFETKKPVRSLLFCCEKKVNDIPRCGDLEPFTKREDLKNRRSNIKTKDCTAKTWNQNGGGPNCCSRTNKCGIGEGGCKANADCQDGLRCHKGMNNCKAFDPTFPEGADCCVPGIY